MSRIGKKPVIIPNGVVVECSSNSVKVKGEKGELSMPIHEAVSVSMKDGVLSVVKNRNSKIAQAMSGTTVRLIENMIIGVTKGFEKKLELNGVGFRMALKGNKIELALGFSHPVVVDIPDDIKVNIEGLVMTISGINRQKVGQFSADVRSLKPVEPYKGKGFKYSDEIVRRKEGKRATS